MGDFIVTILVLIWCSVSGILCGILGDFVADVYGLRRIGNPNTGRISDDWETVIAIVLWIIQMVLVFKLIDALGFELWV